MHFPWKKTKLSRLVNDHLHNSQKRRDGSSLVVETGFPTSLIDLFIKNRDKLKKSSKKRRYPPLTDGNDPTIAGSPAYSASPPPAPAPSPASSFSCPGSPASSVHCPEDLPESSLLVNEDVNGVRKEALVVLKMFLVVCFAVGSKRLAVGITVVVFLMILSEYVGRHVCRMLRLMLLRIRGLLGCNKEITLKSACSSNQEIHQIDELVGETQPMDEVTSGPCLEIESKETVGELKRTKSKIGSKMKKLFQKKSRSRIRHEIEIVDELHRFSDRVDQPEVVDIGAKTQHDCDTNPDIEEVKDGVRWRYLVLSLIILTGLIGGRASALVLTLSWCLLFKLSEALSKHLMKLPVIRCLRS